MTVRDVEQRVLEIGALASDDEAAHSKEDDLYCDVLEAIKSGHETPSSLASAALKSKELEFDRWCA